MLFDWLKSELLPKASTNCILLMNGCDHRSIQSEIPIIIEELNIIFGKNIIKDGNLYLLLLLFFDNVINLDA
jgi:hypothetical protein